ncbi:PBSX protein [Bacillus subtilis]|uniref:BppU family phage baseplate upper protein n=1 Tax=Bacillus subtilis TaxID=1423 RepID=UPI0013774103|nr:BppU family phage baseplate upper protein [Bacillus subtilis]KAF1340204.1 PBSX protein [Bacillus subtilis]
MVYKDANVSASVSTNLGGYRTTTIQFSTQDVGTAKLSFYLFKDGVPLPLSAVTGKLVMVMADGSRFIKNVTIVDKLAGQAEYVLSNDEIKHYGKVKAALNLYYDNGQSLAVVRFTFDITQDLIDYDIAPSAEYYIEQFEDLKEEVEAIVEDLQVKFSDLDNVETKAGAQAKADAVQANLDTHTGNKANPHQVTKAQVGLGNVTNDKQATKTEFDLHANDGIKHITTDERSKWNGAQIHKITQDDGRVIYKSATEVTDYNNLTDTGMYLIYNKGLNGPGLLYSFLLVMSSKNTLVQIAYDGVKGEQAFFRLRKNDSTTWTAWVELESAAGAQKKVDAHATRTDNPHGVTKAQVGLDKVDNVQQASLADFNAHNYNSVRHVVQADKDKWNGSQIYKLTSDTGTQLYGLADKDLFTELATKKTTTFYSNSTTTNQPPVTSSFRGLQIGQDNIGEVLAMGNDGSTWRVTNSNGWKAWKRLITNEDFEAANWQNVTLKNGAATGDRPFQYAKWGNLLLLRGHITATREVVCGTIPSDRLPANGAAVMVPVSGTTGYSKLFVNANGDMKLTGIHSNNDNNVTGYYMDAVVALN